MGVADLVAAEAALAELGDDRLSGETVVDLARGPAPVASQLLQAKRHRTRVPSLAVVRPRRRCVVGGVALRLPTIYRADRLKRVIELAILGILKEGDLHGYELKKHLRTALGPLCRVSFGSLYPALNRLERQGAVAVVAVDDTTAAAMPMTGSFSGEAAAFRARRRVTRGPRNKKVYGITEAGEAHLAELMADPSDDERTFGMKLAFFRWCDRPTRLRLLERRRATLRERLEETRRVVAARSDDPYVRALMEHDSESTMNDIAWIGRLIAREEQAGERRDDRDKEPTGGHP